MNNQHHHRRSIHLRHHDYAQPGAYFVTICTQNRRYLFGDVADGKMPLNPLGDVIQICWNGEIRGTPGIPVWQRNYYDHVIRDDDDLNRIRQYILENPIKWLEDEYYASS